MDIERLDALSRSLSTTPSRRRALALVLSGTLGCMLGDDQAAAHDFAAKCKTASPFMRYLTEAVGLPY